MFKFKMCRFCYASFHGKLLLKTTGNPQIGEHAFSSEYVYIYLYLSHTCMYICVRLLIYIYIYQHMPRGVIMAPLREGVSKWRPFISKVFLNLFGVIWDIHFIFVIWGHGSSAFEFFFWHPKNGACQTCHLRVGWMWRGCQNATPLG